MYMKSSGRGAIPHRW